MVIDPTDEGLLDAADVDIEDDPNFIPDEVVDDDDAEPIA